MKKSTLSTALFFIFVGANVPAFAHTDAPHAAKKTISPDLHPWGQEGDAKRVSRTINIRMSDKMRFTPDTIDVKQGETIRFIVRNGGKVLHEMVIGTEKELAAHAEMMKKHPNMEHDEPFMAHVGPTKKADMVWKFSEPGTFTFACLIPGHFEAGMKGTIRVKALVSKAPGETKPSGFTRVAAANPAATAPAATSAPTAVAAPSSSAPQTEMTEGEVKKVDIDAKKITLKHGEIKNLDMTPMTMVFQVKDEAMLSKVKAGDKVKFIAEKTKSGFAVTTIEVTK